MNVTTYSYITGAYLNDNVSTASVVTLAEFGLLCFETWLAQYRQLPSIAVGGFGEYEVSQGIIRGLTQTLGGFSGPYAPGAYNMLFFGAGRPVVLRGF
jgi:hypothetical protein